MFLGLSKQGKTLWFAFYKVEVMRNMTDLLVCRNVLLAVWLFPAMKLLKNKADEWLVYFTRGIEKRCNFKYDCHYYVWVICTRNLLSVIPIRFQMRLRSFGPTCNRPCSRSFYLNGLDRFENDCTDLAGFLSTCTSITRRLSSPILNTQWFNVNPSVRFVKARSVDNQFVTALL